LGRVAQETRLGLDCVAADGIRIGWHTDGVRGLFEQRRSANACNCDDCCGIGNARALDEDRAHGGVRRHCR
jgi:hypothetical protein